MMNNNLEVKYKTSADFEIREESLQYLKKCCDYLKGKDERPMDETSHLLLVEKLIYLTMEYKAQNNKKDPANIKIDAFTQYYLDRMNKKSVELFNNKKIEESARIIARIVDLITQKNINLVISIPEKLSEFKILTYNNLSCIYRNIGKLSLALKVLNYAVDLEEKLVEKEYGTSYLSIVSTYLNKSAILSEMKKYEKAIEAVFRSIDFLDRLKKKAELPQDQEASVKQLYMLAYYNLGVEYEHLQVNVKAIDYYMKSKKMAEELGKDETKVKIEKALALMKDTSDKADF